MSGPPTTNGDQFLPSDPSGSSRHLVTYADGERIFAQGDRGDEMYIVQDGEVEIVLTGDDGTEVSLATLERGDFFGEMAVLEGAPRTATARSKGGCSVLPLRGALFVEMLQRDPETTLRIMRKLCSRIRELQDRLSDLADGDASFVREAAPTPAATMPAPVSAAPDRPPPARGWFTPAASCFRSRTSPRRGSDGPIRRGHRPRDRSHPAQRGPHRQPLARQDPAPRRQALRGRRGGRHQRHLRRRRTSRARSLARDRRRFDASASAP